MGIKVPDLERINLSRHQVQIAVFDANSSFVSIFFLYMYDFWTHMRAAHLCYYVPRRLPKFTV